MKILIVLLAFLTCKGITKVDNKNYNQLKFESYTKTGHDQFDDFQLPSGRRILINYTENEINKKYDDVSKGFFGTQIAYFDKYIPAKYTSKVIFSRSNKTRESYVFTYNLEEVHYEMVSVTVKGNISAKGIMKSKLKSFEGSVQGDLSITYEKEVYDKTTENKQMKVNIHPNKKVTLRIVGDARITNGVSKYYFLGMCFKKGAFEIVEVKSTVYELIEEDA